MQDVAEGLEGARGRVVRDGDHLVVVISAEDSARLALKEGDEVTFAPVAIDGGKQMTREQAMAIIHSIQGTAPAGYKFDREDANSRAPHAD